MDANRLSAASSASSEAPVTPERRQKKSKPFRSIRKSAARMTGAHGFFSGKKKKKPQVAQTDSADTEVTSESDREPLAPVKPGVPETPKAEEDRTAAAAALVPVPSEQELKAEPDDDEEKRVEAAEETTVTPTPTAAPAPATAPATALATPQRAAQVAQQEPQQPQPQEPQPPQQQQPQQKKDRVVLEPVPAVMPLRQDDTDVVTRPSGDAGSSAPPLTEASTPVSAKAPLAATSQTRQGEAEPVMSPFADPALHTGSVPDPGTSVGSSFDVTTATILSGAKLTSALENIRVIPVVNGCFSHQSDSFEVMLPSSLCRFLTNEQLQTEYISVTHSYPDFQQMDTIVSATLTEADSLPELPSSIRSSCFRCGGASANHELAHRIREYLEKLFSLPSEQLTPARAPIAAFFGVSDEL